MGNDQVSGDYDSIRRGQHDREVVVVMSNDAQLPENELIVGDLVLHNEVDGLGRLWRSCLQHIIQLSIDEVNARRLTRALQLFLPFLTGYESFILSQVIQALDQIGRNKQRFHNKHTRFHRKNLEIALRQAFRNRNVSRILVQSMRVRHDFLWHWSTMVTWNRWFDSWGQIPFFGFTSFPATENFPSTRNHALASMFRVLLGPGNWLTRVVTGGREALITDNPEVTAQNLAAESNGFELANRNQFGTYVGRQKLNQFRIAHRLPIDESIVRSFVAQPMATLINNGVVHVLRQLAKHWNNILSQECGGFSHQRMEQLDPFEMLRLHIPEVLLVLSSLRGRNRWDANVLGPVIRKLQNLKQSSTTKDAQYLILELQTTIVSFVCAGIPSMVNPFQQWLQAIGLACQKIEQEAAQVKNLVLSASKGIQLGYDLFTQVSWQIPSDKYLEKMILDFIHQNDVNPSMKLPIRSALELTTPRDKRTLIELVRKNLADSKPAKLLLGRVKTLLQRELRRERLNRCIQQMSTGKSATRFIHGEWYWLVEGDKQEVYLYDRVGSSDIARKFVHLNSGQERFVSHLPSGVEIMTYVAVAEEISRAQKAFMTMELEHGQKFTYSAFMEFTFLRRWLQKLVVVSQVTCDELDNARLNILKEVQQTGQRKAKVRKLVPGMLYYRFVSESQNYLPFIHSTNIEQKTERQSKPHEVVRYPPQSIIVIGGGPTGLMTTIHCAENVLRSGGSVRLFEARDSFVKGGSSFERSQIVRLDARWIATLRYHLGSSFEDVFIPASGETDSQLGNTLPMQGFVEITIKDLESLLHTEVSRLWSKGLVSVSADSKAKFDREQNCLTKLGMHLKVNDSISRRIDEYGNRSDRDYIWKVIDMIYAQPLGLEDLRVDNEYGVYLRQQGSILPFRLTKVCLRSRLYFFESQSEGIENLKVDAKNLPSVYTKETKNHAGVRALLVQCTKSRKNGSNLCQELLMSEIGDTKFTLDVGNCHVVEATGKPQNSDVHFQVTTTEPYGVLCMQGLKVSMGMHNFGGKRWGAGLLDDIRSQNDQNTRIIGDFTKMVRLAPILKRMHESVAKDENWRMHFKEVLVQCLKLKWCSLPSFLDEIESACKKLTESASRYRRQTLQTRFFETGDNFYLGMEFPREYVCWKRELADNLISRAYMGVTTSVSAPDLLMHHIDRLWYDSCLEIIRTGDVYNPGARHRVPRLFLIKSYSEIELSKLLLGDSFTLSQVPAQRFEILIKRPSEVVARNAQGFLVTLLPTLKVKRESNLTRTPDGNSESNVALATFPVAHFVNHRTMRPNETRTGYMYTFIGDEQATPHFMRYSGLTGACINAMLLNNFIHGAMDDISFSSRFATYSKQTNWSSGEVVLRGTGGCFGEDGFLRPGFSYDHLIDYLHSRLIEHSESHQEPRNILTHDWKTKLAASLVPRGMELNESFISALKVHLRHAIYNRVFGEVQESWEIVSRALNVSFQQTQKDNAKTDLMDWDAILGKLNVNDEMKDNLAKYCVPLAKKLERACNKIIGHAKEAHLYNRRISSELYNQPKSVDSIFDDFAVEAQNFANSFVFAVALSSAILAFRLLSSDVFNALSAAVSVLNISISFDSMTNAARYKIRNEEARILFFDHKLASVKQALLGLLSRQAQQSASCDAKPFTTRLDALVRNFQSSATYYGFEESRDLSALLKMVKRRPFDRKLIQDFQRLLSSKLIVDTYHVNSYLQEYLVNIYQALEDMIAFTNNIVSTSISTDAEILAAYEHVNVFADKLDASLQRGAIRWGFVKQRRIGHGDIAVILRYICCLLCQLLCIKTSRFVPIEIATLHTKDAIKGLSMHLGKNTLRREIQDMTELYWATHESDIASMIFVSASLVFTASIVFTIARIFRIKSLERIAFWTVLPSTFGALLAVQHLLRKLRILWNLWWILYRKKLSAKRNEDRVNIQMVCNVTITQILLTFLRLIAATAAAVALPFFIAESGFGSAIDTPQLVPFWIALAAFGAAILAACFFFMVEYVVRYNLNPRLPVSIVESFRDEISALYWEFHKPWNDVQTKQVQDRITWEYVAREFLHKYRLDTVFAADRFGAILQYIQCGMEKETQQAPERKPLSEL